MGSLKISTLSLSSSSLNDTRLDGIMIVYINVILPLVRAIVTVGNDSYEYT